MSLEKLIHIFIKIGRALCDQYEGFLIHRKYGFRIMNSEQTIRYILKHKCSIARFGEGEFGHMIGRANTGFQPTDMELSRKLRETICHRNSMLLLCIPICMNTCRGMRRPARKWWTWWSKTSQKGVADILTECGCKDYLFGDAMLTRPYMDWKSGIRAKKLYHNLKMLWDNRDILIIEGAQTRLGVGNDLLDNAASIKRILAPAVGAFSCYDSILSAVDTYHNNELILLALGPTATVLAADLADRGCQALDVGHIDVEYEWYLSGVRQKTAIQGKYVNEVEMGQTVSDCNDETYLGQIICEIFSPEK